MQKYFQYYDQNSMVDAHNWVSNNTVGFSYRFYIDNPRLSKKILLIFPSFVHLLATKPMAKLSNASGQSSGGLWVKNRAEI